jgi:replication-associated recombination protein RarA
MQIIHGASPKLNRPTFSVDGELAPKLNQFEISKLMNRSNFTLFLGKPGSGKTTQLISMLQTKSLFAAVFHDVFVVMGPNSRASVKGSFFDQIPNETVFDELDVDTLNQIYESVKQNAEEGYTSLLLLDDVQRNFKNKDVLKLLLHMANNRRHLRLSIWTANQNFKSIPKPIRQVLTNAFIWKCSKSESENIFEELVETHRDKYDEICRLVYTDPHSFMFIDLPSSRIFAGWNEVLIPESK